MKTMLAVGACVAAAGVAMSDNCNSPKEKAPACEKAPTCESGGPACVAKPASKKTCAPCEKAPVAPCEKAADCEAGGPACAEAKPVARKKKAPKFKNKDFYGADGKFDVNKAKDAIVKLCKYHGYPVFPGFRDQLWVSDYGLGKFTELGLAAYMFINNEKDHYMQLEIILLPDQMLPEHWHLAAAGNPVKMEGWLVRYGKSYVVGVGENNLADFPEVKIPKCHDGGKTVAKHVTPTTPGQFVCLAEAESRHWQYGGPEGAIITESANVHTNEGVRHTDKVANDNFLGK